MHLLSLLLGSPTLMFDTKGITNPCGKPTYAMAQSVINNSWALLTET